MRAMGIDVSATRGHDLVVLDESGQLLLSSARQTLAELETALGQVEPDIVAVDSPPGWANSGRSRQLERDLARLGITMYATPQDPGDHGFYRWMRAGFEVFSVADRCGYPLYRGDAAMQHRAIEVFPHASAVALRGRLPARSVPKLIWRRDVLQDAGVEHDSLGTVDQLDAALAALTGIRCLQHKSCTVGVPGDSVLVLPVSALPTARYERDPDVADLHAVGIREDANALLQSAHAASGRLCECGCGAVVRRRYLPGHDARHRSQLLRLARSSGRGTA